MQLRFESLRGNQNQTTMSIRLKHISQKARQQVLGKILEEKNKNPKNINVGIDNNGIIKLEKKPLSVNDAWQGRRFKSDAYKDFIKDLQPVLPNLTLPEPPYKIYFEFGFSNMGSDWDNPIKPFQDILQKRYEFNDSKVFRGMVNKIKVPKGKEYIKFKIYNIKEKVEDIIF